MASNPYENYNIARLKSIEEELVKITRDPKTPGHKRRLAISDLKKLRKLIKEKDKK